MKNSCINADKDQISPKQGREGAFLTYRAWFHLNNNPTAKNNDANDKEKSWSEVDKLLPIKA